VSRSRIGIWYRVAAAIVKPGMLVIAKRDWQGMERMPSEGGFITVVNHNSYLDPLSYAHYQYNTGRVPRFLAKEALFRIPVAGKLLRWTGQIPVFRESTDATRAFRAAVAAVEKGECVAVYPEGTLTRDPELWPMAGKTGAARIALQTGAPVIPVAQWGAQRIVPPYARGKKKGEPKLRVFPRSTLTVLAGPPVDLADLTGKEPTAEVLRTATDRIMDAITELLEQVREEDAPAERFDMRKARAERFAESGDTEEETAR
jgi:1-acyl-sn-glycerol-3-phosphate acyltransferase